MNNWNYPIRILIPHLILAIAIFVITLVSGFFVPLDYANETLEQLRQTLAPLEHLGPLAWFVIIFLNNAIKAVGAIILGILIGLPPLIFVGFNGFTIGVIVSALKSAAGPGVIIASLAPHGIIEVPAFLICTALGLSLGMESFRFLIRRNSKVRERLRQSLKFYVKWLLPAFFIAAIIEVFITPLIILWLTGEAIMQ
jgi:stage II sporulation protein M